MFSEGGRTQSQISPSLGLITPWGASGELKGSIQKKANKQLSYPANNFYLLMLGRGKGGGSTKQLLRVTSSKCP